MLLVSSGGFSPTVHRSISFLFVSNVYLLNSYGSFYTRPLSYLIHTLDLVFLLVVLYGECLTVYPYDIPLFLLKIYIFHIRGYYHVSLFLVYSSTLLSYKVSFCLYMFGIYSSSPIKKDIRYYLTFRD